MEGIRQFVRPSCHAWRRERHAHRGVRSHRRNRCRRTRFPRAVATGRTMAAHGDGTSYRSRRVVCHFRPADGPVEAHVHCQLRSWPPRPGSHGSEWVRVGQLDAQPAGSHGNPSSGPFSSRADGSSFTPPFSSTAHRRRRCLVRADDAEKQARRQRSDAIGTLRHPPEWACDREYPVLDSIRSN